VRFETALRVGQPLRFWMPAPVLSGLVLVLISGCSMVGQVAGVDHSVAPTSFDTRTTALTLQKSDVGGIETVVARDSNDEAQIDSVRNLLRNEMAQFQQGNYQDPAREHGMPMPGSKELEAGYTRVQVGYTDLPAGGQITYTASDPSLVDTVHAWFDRRELAH
jgi:hypothetical protein